MVRTPHGGIIAAPFGGVTLGLPKHPQQTLDSTQVHVMRHAQLMQ